MNGRIVWIQNEVIKVISEEGLPFFLMVGDKIEIPKTDAQVQLALKNRFLNGDSEEAKAKLAEAVGFLTSPLGAGAWEDFQRSHKPI